LVVDSSAIGEFDLQKVIVPGLIPDSILFSYVSGDISIGKNIIFTCNDLSFERNECPFF